MPRGRWTRPLVLLLVIVAGGVLVLTVGVPPLADVRILVARAGWAGPALYAALYAALTLTPAPAGVLSITAGVLFGFPTGLGVVLAGAVVGAGLAFGLARTLGRDAVRRWDSDRLHRLDGLLRRRGLLAVIGMRLIPLVPFTALSYACGLSAVGLRDYLLGTAIGILPAAAAYVGLGATGADPGSVPFLLAVGGLGVLTLAGVVLGRRRGVADTVDDRETTT